MLRHNVEDRGEDEQIDKTFLIAEPMRKVGWTKRFAAGWGERRRGNGRRSSRKSDFWDQARVVSEKAGPMRGASPKPRLVWLEDAAQDVTSGVSG